MPPGLRGDRVRIPAAAREVLDLRLDALMLDAQRLLHADDAGEERILARVLEGATRVGVADEVETRGGRIVCPPAVRASTTAAPSGAAGSSSGSATGGRAPV